MIPHRHTATCFDTTVVDDSVIRERVDRLKMGLDDELQLDVRMSVSTSVRLRGNRCHTGVSTSLRGDMENPKCGVRGVIPGRQQCRKTG